MMYHHYVPVDETIKNNTDRAFENDWFNREHNLNIAKLDLMELLRIAYKNQLFQFEGNLYKQVDGVATLYGITTGSPYGKHLHVQNWETARNNEQVAYLLQMLCRWNTLRNAGSGSSLRIPGDIKQESSLYWF